MGMRGRKLCLITHEIQPEVLAAKGTNDSLWENAWIQSSKHALTEERCRGGRLQSNPVPSVPCQGRSQGAGRRRLGSGQKLGHVIGIVFVAVGTKVALTVNEGISVGFSKMDLGGGFLSDTRILPV